MTHYSGDGGDYDYRLESAGSYIDLPLNSTGQGWITVGGSGITKFMLRNLEFDINDVAPGGGDTHVVTFGDGSSGKEPKLKVTYSSGRLINRFIDEGVTSVNSLINRPVNEGGQ
jgi:hypothetical protein